MQFFTAFTDNSWWYLKLNIHQPLKTRTKLTTSPPLSTFLKKSSILLSLLSAQELRDSLALHYKKPLSSIPSMYEGCGVPLVLSMPLIVILGAWSLIGIMRLGMHLVTLFLWFGHQLLRSHLCVMVLPVLIH